MYLHQQGFGEYEHQRHGRYFLAAQTKISENVVIFVLDRAH